MPAAVSRGLYSKMFSTKGAEAVSSCADRVLSGFHRAVLFVDGTPKDEAQTAEILPCQIPQRRGPNAATLSLRTPRNISLQKRTFTIHSTTDLTSTSTSTSIARSWSIAEGCVGYQERQLPVGWVPCGSSQPGFPSIRLSPKILSDALLGTESMDTSQFLLISQTFTFCLLASLTANFILSHSFPPVLFVYPFLFLYVQLQPRCLFHAPQLHHFHLVPTDEVDRQHRSRCSSMRESRALAHLVPTGMFVRQMVSRVVVLWMLAICQHVLISRQVRAQVLRRRLLVQLQCLNLHRLL